MDEQERKILDLLAEAWNEYCKLSIGHPDDARDFVNAIHNAQRIIMSREPVRLHPDYYRQPNSMEAQA
jgi:hypothetical protein